MLETTVIKIHSRPVKEERVQEVFELALVRGRKLETMPDLDTLESNRFLHTANTRGYYSGVKEYILYNQDLFFDMMDVAGDDYEATIKGFFDELPIANAYRSLGNVFVRARRRGDRVIPLSFKQPYGKLDWLKENTWFQLALLNKSHFQSISEELVPEEEVEDCFNRGLALARQGKEREPVELFDKQISFIAYIRGYSFGTREQIVANRDFIYDSLHANIEKYGYDKFDSWAYALLQDYNSTRAAKKQLVGILQAGCRFGTRDLPYEVPETYNRSHWLTVPVWKMYDNK